MNGRPKPASPRTGRLPRRAWPGLRPAGRGDDSVFHLQISTLGPRDRRVIALVLHRLAEIEALDGADAAEAALEGLLDRLAKRRRRATG